MGETMAFEEYITIAITLDLFLSLGKPPLETLWKYFNGCHTKLVESFSSASITYVCITSDIWSSNAKEDTLSVVGLLLTTLTLIGN